MRVRMEFIMLISTIRDTVKLKLSSNVLPLKRRRKVRHRYLYHYTDYKSKGAGHDMALALRVPSPQMQAINRIRIYRSILVMAFKCNIDRLAWSQFDFFVSSILHIMQTLSRLQRMGTLYSSSTLWSGSTLTACVVIGSAVSQLCNINA